MKNYFRVGVASTLFLISLAATSSTTCTGNVSGVSMTGSGGVIATITDTSMGVNLKDVVFCSINSKDSYSEFSPESCKSVFSLLIAAQMAGKSISFWVREDNYICSGSWKDLAGHYHFKML
jgi:hypothetical protein